MRRTPLAKTRVETYTLSRNNGVSPSTLEQLFKKEYVTVDRVPDQYKEPYLTRGYRQPYSSFLDCLISVFRLNNETLNIWTHLIPLIYLLFYFRRTFPCDVWPLSHMDPRYYPLLAEEISSVAWYLGSVVAHTFNSMTPRIRHTCFYTDYACMSIFGVAVGCSNYYYLRPLSSQFFLFTMPNVCMGLSSVCSVLAIYLCCQSRHQWEISKSAARAVAYTLPYLTNNLPIFYRVLQCVLIGRECTTALAYTVVMNIFILCAGILYSTRIPERFYPEIFDICGHSHQWLHVLSSLGMIAHFWAVHLELEERQGELETLLEGITFNSSLGWIFGTMAVCVFIVLWFSSKLTIDGKMRTTTHSKEK